MSEETSAGETGRREAGGSWWDAEPATPEQIETIRRDLEAPPAQRNAAFSRGAVCKLLAAYDRQLADWKRIRDAWVTANERAEAAEGALEEMRGRDGTWEPGRWRRVRRPDGSLWMETSDHDEAQAEAEKTGWPLERLYVNTRSEWRVVDKGEVGDGG